MHIESIIVQEKSNVNPNNEPQSNLHVLEITLKRVKETNEINFNLWFIKFNQYI